jgi:hypothetical protein
MGSTPAGELARIKVQHPVWSIREGRPGNGGGFIASRWLADGRPQQVRAPSLAALERSLWVWEKLRPDWYDPAPQDAGRPPAR